VRSTGRARMCHEEVLRLLRGCSLKLTPSSSAAPAEEEVGL